MIKKYKWKLLISSILILIPALFGLIIWQQIPSQMPTHFGIDGNPDTWGGKAIVVILPVVLLALHWLCMLITAKDPKNKDQTEKAMNLIFWIMPMLSFVVSAIMYAVAFDMGLQVSLVLPLFLGVLFIVIGNYLPKCKQNHTLGIKLVWTLCNEETWHATHRFGGKVWVGCGFVCLACVLLPMTVSLTVSFAAILLAVLLPTVFAWRYYKTLAKKGTVPEKPQYPTAKWAKNYRTISILIVILLLAFMTVIMFTGDISVSFGESTFVLEATYWERLEISYNAVEEVVYVEDFQPGVKVNGFNSARLNLGLFENSDLGRYTIYAYAGSRDVVLLKNGSDTLVISGPDDTATRAIYDTLVSK